MTLGCIVLCLDKPGRASQASRAPLLGGPSEVDLTHAVFPSDPSPEGSACHLAGQFIAGKTEGPSLPCLLAWLGLSKHTCKNGDKGQTTGGSREEHEKERGLYL